jgi:two-component system cell cycle sensor histidine kinase/response regulator CckA
MSAAWWYPKPTGDPGRDRHAVSIHIGCIVLSIAFALLIARAVWRNGQLLLPDIFAELAVLGALVLNYVGKWRWATWLGTYGVMFAVALIVTEARDGFRSIAMLAFPGLLLIGVMSLRTRDYMALALATLLTVTGLGVAEIHGLIPVVPIVRTPTDYLTVFFVDMTLAVIAIFGGLLARDARQNLAELRATVDQLDTANRELRRSEAKYRSFIELAVDAIFVVNRDGVILEVNRQASALTGIPREHLLSASMMTVLAAVEPEGNPLPLDVLAQGVPIMRPCRIVRANGTVVEAEVHSALLPEGLILCFCRDITERMRTSEERKELQAQLIQAQKMESIGRLAGGIAHDFNNLLTVINGYSRLLLDSLNASDPSRESLEVIHKAGGRAAGLTQQLLAFSRKQILEPRVLDLNHVVAEMRWMLSRLVGEDVELGIELSAEPVMICADLHQLNQVILNLAVNARDAMPGGGKVRIQTAVLERSESFARSNPGSRSGRCVMLAVSDTGRGMDVETRRHIFEPFFTTKAAGKGTGLGLSMTQGVVEQSGGRIEVESEPGRGTTFRIYLPIAIDAPGDSGEPMTVSAPASKGRETVLVVEDQAEVRKYAADALEAYGYRVIQAENPSEALLLCQREGVDLVLTDVVMPNMSGSELADRLAKQSPGIKVLFMSGYAHDAIKDHGVLHKKTEIVEKPFSPGQLAGKVREMLAMPARPARILVADDEPGVRSFLRKVLEGAGYEVMEAANGKEALQKVRAGGVDMLITDLVMPEQEGIETIMALRGEAAGIGIIAISGAFGGRYLEAARQLGAQSVLTKPVSAEVLLGKVAEVLKARPRPGP